MFILEGRNISLCRIVCALYLSFKVYLKYCLSCLCLTSPFCFAVQLCGALALGLPRASLELMVLGCWGFLGGIQHACSDWSLLKILADSTYQNLKWNIYSYLNNVSLCNNLTLGVALLLVLLVPLCGCLVSCWIVVDLETWLLAGRSQLSEDGTRTLELYTFFAIVFSNTFIYSFI